ncbi:MAG: SH3 domain-containing protein [Treponema sp.]|jgi:hypothetical protein|nr:SH3 domain-containing protein [Treponema sp.]
MKKLCLFYSLLCLIFVSCQAKDDPGSPKVAENTADQTEASQLAAGAPEPADTQIPAALPEYGYMLRVNAGLYDLEKDTGAESDVTKWIDSIPLGEKLEVLGPARKATFHGDKTVNEFVKVRRDTGRDTREGYVFAVQLATGASLAVVTNDKANIFRTPNTLDVTSNILAYKTVLGYYPATEKDKFVEFKAYDPVRRVYYSNYIQTSSISTKESDIQASILLQTAQALDAKDTVRREFLLNAALSDYPDSFFATEIRELLYPGSTTPAAALTVAGVPPAASLQTMTSSQQFFYVNDNDVNVRETPNGNVLRQLSRGDEVTVSEETVNTYTINDQTAKWYRITEPQEGWVFGAFLQHDYPSNER